MVKYASALPRESIVDVEATVAAPQAPIEACSQSQVELHVTSIKCVSRSAPLPFEVTDAARSAEAVKKAAEAGELLPTVGQVSAAGMWGRAGLMQLVVAAAEQACRGSQQGGGAVSS